MNKEDFNQEGQIIYLSHGGGPLPILGDLSHEKMNEFMKNLPKKVRKPEAIIVVSAHWEEEIVTIQSGKKPDIIYDYYGFPKAAYNIKYPCLGDSSLALEIAELLNENNIDCLLNDKQPYDHGVYIPLKMMYPNADIPVLQISLNQNLDPLTHLNMGKALRPLLKKNILVIGSGFSFHNMRAFDFKGENIEDNKNNSFQDKLVEVCCNERVYERMREQLINWEKFPNARYCHPREEHLLPLFLCAGLSKNVAVKIFDDYILGKRATAFLWH